MAITGGLLFLFKQIPQICALQLDRFENLVSISSYREPSSSFQPPVANMVKTSVLNDALKNINNAEKAGKRQVMIRPSSKVIVKFLQVMQKHGTFKRYR